MKQDIHTTMTRTEWALLLTLGLIWGGSFFFIEVAVTELPPLTVVTARVAGGSVFLCLGLMITGRRLPWGGRIWLTFAIMGFLNNVIPFTLIAWAQTFIESGLASILNATTPLFTVLIAHMLTLDERMTPTRVFGVVIGFCGVTVMIGADALSNGGAHAIPQLAVLAASIGYASSSVYARRLRTLGVPAMTAATGQIIAATAMMVPLMLIIDQPWSLPPPSIETWGALIGLAFLATFIAYIIYYRLVGSAGSVNVMLVTFLVPVSAIVLGAVILDERLSLNHFVGMAAIGVGLAAIDGRPLARLRRRTA